MAMNPDTVRAAAADAVLAALTELYKDTEPDPEGMKGFAEAIAEAAVVAVQHVMDQGETEVSGEGIR